MAEATARPAAQPHQPPQKHRAAAQRDAAARRTGGLAPLARAAISLLIVWHLVAIFLAAMTVASSSQLVLDVGQKPPIQWYLDALYLNHGHSFFAPDVGPGHLIRYEIYDDRNNLLESGELPDRKEHRPRLRYHRHFMLADQATFPSPNQQFRDAWQRKFLESYAQHLLRTHEEAAAVRVRRFAHWPAPRDYVLRGAKLNDPESYQQLMEVTQRRSDLPSEASSQNGAWQSDHFNRAGQGRIGAGQQWTSGGLR